MYWEMLNSAQRQKNCLDLASISDLSNRFHKDRRSQFFYRAKREARTTHLERWELISFNMSWQKLARWAPSYATSKGVSVS